MDKKAKFQAIASIFLVIFYDDEVMVPDAKSMIFDFDAHLMVVYDSCSIINSLK